MGVYVVVARQLPAARKTEREREREIEPFICADYWGFTVINI
jgi:hypothetical protein